MPSFEEANVAKFRVDQAGGQNITTIESLASWMLLLTIAKPSLNEPDVCQR